MGFLTGITAAIFGAMKDPTGFVSRTTSTLAFVNGTLTFTIAPTAVNFEVYSAGQLFYKKTESIAIANTVGLHYIYYVNGVTLTESMTAWNIASANVPIATVFWNGTAGYLYDERHGVQMDGRTHEYLHETMGARFASGLELTIAADALTHTIALGEWYDDDIEWLPTAQSSTPFAYLISSAWQKTAAQAPAFYTNGGVPQYNNPADVNGLVDVDNNKYFVTWILTTNTYPSSECIFVMGRNQYNSQALAEAEAPPALSTAPSAEILILYQLVMQRNGAAVIWKHTSDFRRVSSVASNYVATDHGALAGLLEDDHTQYLLLAGRAPQQTIAGKLWIDSPTDGVNPASNDNTTALFLLRNNVSTEMRFGASSDAPNYPMWIQVAQDPTVSTAVWPLCLQPLGGALGIRTLVPTAEVHLLETKNAALSYKVENLSNGAVAQARLWALSDVNDCIFGVTGSGNTDFGAAYSGCAFFYSGANRPMLFATNAQIRLVIEGGGDVDTAVGGTYLKVNGKKFIFGANDSSGAGYRTVKIENA